MSGVAAFAPVSNQLRFPILDAGTGTIMSDMTLEHTRIPDLKESAAPCLCSVQLRQRKCANGTPLRTHEGTPCQVKRRTPFGKQR